MITFALKYVGLQLRYVGAQQKYMQVVTGNWHTFNLIVFG